MLAMKKHAQRAFTLVEVMVVLALLALLMTFAVPGFRDFLRTSQLSSQTNTVIAALYAAKNEAIKHNSNSYFVPVDGADWASGWMVFVDNDFNQTYDLATDTLIMQGEPLPDIVRLEGSGTMDEDEPYISFNGSGYPRTKTGASGNASLSLQLKGVSGAELVRNSRFIVLAVTGRIRSCKPQSSTDASCKSGLTS